MQSQRAFATIAIALTTLGLTSCGGGGDTHLSGVQLEELDAALVQIQSKERADQAALASAIATGADPATIAQLKATLDWDETEQSAIFITWDEDFNNLSIGGGNQDNAGVH